MRLDSRKGDIGWTVYHAERCQVLRHAVWVDMDTARWGEYAQPIRLVNGDPHTVEYQAKRIDVHHDRMLVVIDPVEDEQSGCVQATEAIGSGPLPGREG